MQDPIAEVWPERDRPMQDPIAEALDSFAAFLWFLSIAGPRRNAAYDVRNARIMHESMLSILEES